MTDPTAPWGIPLYGPLDTIPSLAGIMNAQSTALNTALTNLQNGNAFRNYATYTALVAAPGTVIGQHATVYADPDPLKNLDFRWSGTRWNPTVQKGNRFGSGGGTNNSGGIWYGSLYSITFPIPYATAPLVFLDVNGNGGLQWPVKQTTTPTAVTYWMARVGASPINADLSWLALPAD